MFGFLRVGKNEKKGGEMMVEVIREARDVLSVDPAFWCCWPPGSEAGRLWSPDEED